MPDVGRGKFRPCKDKQFGTQRGHGAQTVLQPWQQAKGSNQKWILRKIGASLKRPQINIITIRGRSYSKLGNPHAGSCVIGFRLVSKVWQKLSRRKASNLTRKGTLNPEPYTLNPKP